VKIAQKVLIINEIKFIKQELIFPRDYLPLHNFSYANRYGQVLKKIADME
jgi:hypothetical protein